MDNENEELPEGWTKDDLMAWNEFRRRMDNEPYIEFFPKCQDVRVGSFAGWSESFSLWTRAVLLPFPLDLVRAVLSGLKAMTMGIAGLAIGLAAVIWLPILVIIHRLALTVGALFGRLRVVPANDSLAEHLNYRLKSVRQGMEEDGYDVSKFWHEVDPDEINEETRTHLLRRWP